MPRWERCFLLIVERKLWDKGSALPKGAYYSYVPEAGQKDLLKSQSKYFHTANYGLLLPYRELL